MIKDNVIYFGYGTVAVDSLGNKLYFREIKPPCEIGSCITEKLVSGEVAFTEKQADILFKNYNEVLEFEQLLNTHVNCSKERILEYKDLVLDFTKWNVGSLIVVKKHLSEIQRYLLRLIAC